MAPVRALEAVCDLLPFFAFAALFPACGVPGPVIAAVLLLTALSSLILGRSGHTAVRILCGLLPALGLLAAKTQTQVLFSVPALLVWFVLAVSGKSEICYEDYKYWFGIPAMLTPILLLVGLSRSIDGLPVSAVSVLCASAYLCCGVLVLRRKRLGAGAGAEARLMNVAEVAGAALSGMLACALLWKLLAASGKLLEALAFPFGLLMNALIHAFTWITWITGKWRPEEEAASLDPEPDPNIMEVLEKDPTLPTPQEDYAWAETLTHILAVLLILALFVFIVCLAYKAVKRLRTGGHAGDPDYEAAVQERSAPGKRGKRKQKRDARTNSERIREIYREYLSYIRQNGVSIGRQTTSAEALAASRRLADSEEAEELRTLYIRARYNDGELPSGEDVRRAGELWDAIREEYEAEKKRRAEEA
ncbi:MAG: hypothetical protein IJH47_10060 [Oscillospiraceae bacterium]|nr:hypothetical protein [Oscillospiraceae bacterium]